MKKKLHHGLGFRISIFAVLLVFLPAGGVLFLGSYEKQLLRDLEQSMGVLGRATSVALGDRAYFPRALGTLDPDACRDLLRRWEGKMESRVRILDHRGEVLADSAALAPPAIEPRTYGRGESIGPDANQSWIYQIGALPVRILRWFLGAPEPVKDEDIYRGRTQLQGPEIDKALKGQYGATTRLSAGGQVSVTLYTAFPIHWEGQVRGVVLVTQSTYRILRALYLLRLEVFKVILWSLAAALAVGLVLSLTLTRPLKALSRQAQMLTQTPGRPGGLFVPLKQNDEIGELSRALSLLTQRLNGHLDFIEGFSQDMAHELKNPLASIRIAAENWSAGETSPQNLKFHALIQEDLGRMEALIRGIREISQVDALSSSEERDAVDLAALVRLAVEDFRLRRTISVIWELPETPILYNLAAHRWTQVVDNLLDNAADFSPSGAPIQLRLRSLPRQIVLEVRDYGPGVPPQDRERVFQRFFSHRPAAEKTRHAGLGLAIVKSLVEAWDGRVHVESGDPGALFVVKLPLGSDPGAWR